MMFLCSGSHGCERGFALDAIVIEVIAGTGKSLHGSGLTILLVPLRFIVVLPVMRRWVLLPPCFSFINLCRLHRTDFLGLKAYNILPPIKTLEGPVGWSLQSARSSLSVRNDHSVRLHCLDLDNAVR